MIRPADLRDLGEIQRLEDENFPEDGFSRRRMRYLVTSSSSLTLVWDGNGIKGYVMLLFRKDTDAARMYSICVDRAARNRGLGSALMRAAGEAARNKGCRRMTLEVREGNAEAIEFYAFHGFKGRRRLRDYYAPGVDGLRMEKRL
ncbi:MAG: GNAT family N-acetyltransferase [Euryarchaeota archaeon]|nr:GNAT family N-acetyltransferase [Euryarchaeota archaeon]